MKIWKIVLISAIIAIINFPLHLWAYQVFFIKPSLARYPEGLRPYVDFNSFFETLYGSSAVFVWICLCVLWGYLSFRHITAKPQKALSILIIALLFLMAFPTMLKLSYGTEWNVYHEVDILLMCDEEFYAHPEWMTNAENLLISVCKDRFMESHISLCKRGIKWLTWNSTDSENIAYYLMEEALGVSGLPLKRVQIVPDFWGFGLISGSLWRDPNYPVPIPEGFGVWVDLLLIFTGQNVDAKALSPPMCNASIIRYDSVNFLTLTHEIGHQYYLQHCGNFFCPMNKFPLGDQFCGNCRALLTANNEKWLTDPEVFIGALPTQGKIVLPYEGNFNYGMLYWHGKVKYNTTLPIRAEPLRGFVFDHFYGWRAPFSYTVGEGSPQPDSLTIYAQQFVWTFNDTWTFGAWFITIKQACDVNGDGKVDIFDIVIVVGHFGTTPTSPNWLKTADVNRDGKVDIFDITLVTNNFGAV